MRPQLITEGGGAVAFDAPATFYLLLSSNSCGGPGTSIVCITRQIRYLYVGLRVASSLLRSLEFLAPCVPDACATS